jgi:hypothetical protein
VHFLSPAFLLFAITTILPFCHSTGQRRLSIPLFSILHLPENLGCLSNSILIKMAFYNQFLFLLPPKPSFSYIHKPSIHKQKHIPSLQQLFILIYILSNISIVFAVQQNSMPMSALAVMPCMISLFAMTSIKSSYPSFTHTHPRPTFHDTSNLSTNAGKLAYLTAWQSLESSSSKYPIFLQALIRFASTPERRVVSVTPKVTSLT